MQPCCSIASRQQTLHARHEHEAKLDRKSLKEREAFLYFQNKITQLLKMPMFVYKKI